MKKFLNFLKENDLILYILFCSILSYLFLHDLFKDTIAITFISTIFLYFFKGLVDSRTTRKQKNFEIKQKYYHEFLKAFTEQLAYICAGKKPDFETNKNFTIETGRLVIYASSKVVEYVEKTKKNPANYNIVELFNLIREDLELDSINEEYNFLTFKLDNKTSEK